MIAPERRIWIVQPHAYTDPLHVEIIVLGVPEDIAPMVTALANALAMAPGLDGAQPLVMGSQQIGFTARRNRYATHENPIAEVHMELRARLPIGMIGWDVDEDHVMGGSW